jgi:two-component SAPR family response regulator
VDDEPDLLQLFSGVLKSAGFDVISFDNPLSAVDYMQEHHSEICLLVTDWRMPEMNGLELTKKVTEIDNEIKSMLMSAYDLEKDQLKEINNNDYLRKPIENNKLIDAVKNEVYGTIILQAT